MRNPTIATRLPSSSAGECLGVHSRGSGRRGSLRSASKSRPGRPFLSRLAILGFGLGLGAGTSLLGACAATTSERLGLPPPKTVPFVDIDRYLGTWYEVASFPQRFQRGCTATTATYTLRPDGQIDVLNRCRLETPDGPEKSARGRARIVDPASNAKLKVSFFRPFWGAYWIIDLDADYAYAVVGHPSRDYLWILSRTPDLSEELYESILGRLREQGFEVARLVRTVHGEAPAAPASLRPATASSR